MYVPSEGSVIEGGGEGFGFLSTTCSGNVFHAVLIILAKFFL